MSEKDQSIWDGFESLFSDQEDLSLAETMPASHVVSEIGNQRPILNVLIIVDVSGSMNGIRIGQVNYALENIIKGMRNRFDLNSVIKIGIMEFSDQAEWKTEKPLLLEDYVFTELKTRQAITCYAKAFDALNLKLSRDAFMDPGRGEYYAPLILFVTDGEPVDVEEYPAALDRLFHNGWFRKASRYAIAVGSEAGSNTVRDVLIQFTGLKENVRYADEGEALCELIEFITIRGSEVQTSMASTLGKERPEDRSIFQETDPHLFSSMFEDKE